MRERLKALQRVLRVHELIEEMREAEAQQAAAEVRETERAIGRQHAIAQASAMEGREALAGGDRMVWSLASAQQEVARWRAERLTPVLSERERRSNVSRARHIDSRQWSERMRRLVEQVAGNLEEMEEKRMQRERDDRYLSRRRWKQAKRSSGAVSE